MRTPITNSLLRGALVVLALLAFGVPAANAAPINYGDFSDIPPGSVMYLDVTETANTPGDSEPLFGAPTIIGNKLDFDPAGFSASATGGAADITDAQLNFTLMSATRSEAISSFSVMESGDYSLLGTGGAATQIHYAVSVSNILVLEIDGIALGTPISLAGASASGGDNLGNGTDALTPWNLALNYDVNAALLAAQVAFEYGATKLEIVIDNQLVAISEAASIAFIAKKDFMIHVPPPEVPEPSAAALLGLGLLGLGVAGRRRS